MRAAEVKGSEMSVAADSSRWMAGGAEKGARERRRMACVMVGWKSPPCGECARRWHGRVWPSEKKRESTLA